MISITGLARNTEYTFLTNVSPMIHSGTLVPDVSSWKKPPTQLLPLTCISRKSAFKISHEMLLFPNFIFTVTFVPHAVPHAETRVRRLALQCGQQLTICVVACTVAGGSLAAGDLRVQRGDGVGRAADESGARVDSGVRRGARVEGH